MTKNNDESINLASLAPSAHRGTLVAFNEIKYDKSLGDLPKKATEGSIGYDIKASIPSKEPIRLGKGERALIPTSLYPVYIDNRLELQIRPRSGLAAKHGVTVLNSPGTIDNDYRGEIKIILINLGDEPYEINHGDRIAQIVLLPKVICSEFTLEMPGDALPGAAGRGTGGFGSTGVN